MPDEERRIGMQNVLDAVVEVDRKVDLVSLQQGTNDLLTKALHDKILGTATTDGMAAELAVTTDVAFQNRKSIGRLWKTGVTMATGSGIFVGILKFLKVI